MVRRTLWTTTVALLLSLAICCACSVLFYLQRNAAEQSFVSKASAQLDKIEQDILKYIEPGTVVVRSLSNLPIIKNSAGNISSYVATTETTTLYYKNQTDYEKRIYSELIKAHFSNKNFGLVFMANKDGQYTQAPEGKIKTPGYDPRKRPWYQEAINSTKEILISTPYKTTGAGMVCSLLTKTYDTQDNLIGVIGVDFRLETLTQSLSSIKVFNTGYVIAIDNTGQILADIQHPRNLLKNVKEIGQEWQKIHTTITPHTLTLDGKRKLIIPRISPDTGWLVAIIVNYDEVSNKFMPLYYAAIASGILFILIAVGIIGYASYHMKTSPRPQL